MSPDKQNLLYSRYPKLFRDKDLPMTQSCMYWGLDCGIGWFDLLNDLCAQLDLLERTVGLEVVFDQIKEKMSTLRAYHHVARFPESAITDEDKALWNTIVYGLVSCAEEVSAQTCEETGEYGTMHVSPTGWYRTLSATKAAELGFKTHEEWLKLRALEGDRNA